ncbi:AraC family transcriptional regulator [Nocardia yamanashiensis]|uniref:AraC family transcriptional regulator n=1 Tax=Nocardia yamanashiensis TaxID=209247 RepID=UPI00082EE9F6|nr:AraC family transcriptional regulator [Nocardia yamanashiensis]
MIEGTLPARTAAVIRTTALHVGITPAQLTLASGLDTADLGDELLRVPTESAWRMWELIDAVAGPGSGLLATDQAERNGGLHLWDYLFTSGETVAAGIRTAMELRAVVTDPAVGWTVVEDGGLLSIRDAGTIEPELILPPIEEFVLSMMLRRVRTVARRHVVPVRVAFTHHAAERRPYLIDEFGTARMDFGAPASEITFLDIGAQPTGADPHLARMLRHYAELSLASARPELGWLDKFRAATTAALARNELDLDRVARRLAISSRTLQRRLQESGTSWRAEVETAREQYARDLLRDTTLPIRSISARLGYTDPRALRRAFHRWTGTTPDTFRRESLAAEPRG